MQQPASGVSILIVDDTIENLHLLSSLLSDRGYEARPVTSGRQALQAARSFPPEVILLDVSMPDMDGYEVCAQLKQVDELREIPVIFLTALNSTADKVKAFESGGADYITKPFQVDEVLARVKVQVALRQSRVELQQSYERLQTMERLRDDLVQMVVHDMRSPLSALTLLLDSLQSDRTRILDDRTRQNIEHAVHAADTVNRMANDLLDVSRLEENKFPLDRRPNDVAVICSEVRARLAAANRTRTIEVEGDAVVEIPCDRIVIDRIVENLVSNAIKYTPKGESISVSVRRVEQGARIAVRDHGPGIQPEDRERIFEKFGSVKVRKERRYHSVGLGLTFCKLAVEAHGGRIGVEPGVPVGSTFWFHLPA